MRGVKGTRHFKGISLEYLRPQGVSFEVSEGILRFLHQVIF